MKCTDSPLEDSKPIKERHCIVETVHNIHGTITETFFYQLLTKKSSKSWFSKHNLKQINSCAGKLMLRTHLAKSFFLLLIFVASLD